MSDKRWNVGITIQIDQSVAETEVKTATHTWIIFLGMQKTVVFCIWMY